MSLSPTERLFHSLAAFLKPLSEANGLTLRPFSINFFSMTQLAGLHVGQQEWAELSDIDRERELAALLVMLTTDDDAELGKALRASKGNFEEFYWNFVFARARQLDASKMVVAEEVLTAELPAIEAATVEIRTPPSMQGGEKAPPNS